MRSRRTSRCWAMLSRSRRRRMRSRSARVFTSASLLAMAARSCSNSFSFAVASFCALQVQLGQSVVALLDHGFEFAGKHAGLRLVRIARQVQVCRDLVLRGLSGVAFLRKLCMFLLGIHGNRREAIRPPPRCRGARCRVRSSRRQFRRRISVRLPLKRRAPCRVPW